MHNFPPNESYVSLQSLCWIRSSNSGYLNAFVLIHFNYPVCIEIQPQINLNPDVV